MLCVDIKNCASYLHGKYIFRKIVNKNLPEGEKCNRKALDGNCDGYMCGLGGAEKRKSEKWNRKTLDGKGDGYMCGLGGAEKRKC